MKSKLPVLAALCALFVLIFASDRVIASAAYGLRLCWELILPSLFPFFVVSALLSRLDFPGLAGQRLAPLAKKLFHVSGAGATALFIGLTGGYPLGASYLAELEEQGRLSPRETERLLGFCNNSGPAFLVGAIGAGIFHSTRIGLLLYTSHGLAAILAGILLRGDEPFPEAEAVGGGAVPLPFHSFYGAAGRLGSAGRAFGPALRPDRAGRAPVPRPAHRLLGAGRRHRRHARPCRHSREPGAGGGLSGLGRRLRPFSNPFGAGGEPRKSLPASGGEAAERRAGRRAGLWPFHAVSVNRSGAPKGAPDLSLGIQNENSTPTRAEPRMKKMGCSFFTGLTQRVSTSSTEEIQKDAALGVCIEMEHGDSDHQQARRGDQTHRAGAQAVKGRVHSLVLAEFLQHPGDDQDDDDGGSHQAQGRHHRAGYPGGGKAHVGGHIDADGARGGLGHGDHIRKLCRGKPAGFIRHAVEEGQGRHPAAHGEEAGLEELPEQAEQQHHFPRTPILVKTIPAAAQNST